MNPHTNALARAVLGIATIIGGCSAGVTKPAPSTQASSCEEVPYTVHARNGMGTFSVKAADILAKKLSGNEALPSLKAKAQFSRVTLLGSGKQASKDVLEQYFCRIKQSFPERLNEIKTAEAALDGVLDHTFDGKHFSSNEGRIALDVWLKDTGSATLNAAPHPFSAAEKAALTRAMGSNNFTKLTETSAEVTATVAKYQLGVCGNMLVASSASSVTAGLATSLGSLDGIVASLLTASADGIQLARRLRDGADAVFASVPEADALKGLGVTCNREGSGE